MGEQIIKQILFGIMYNVSISPECQRLSIKIETERLIRIAKGYSDFNELPETLQHILLKQNLFMMYTLIQSSMEKYKSIEALAMTYFHQEDRKTVKTFTEVMIATNPEHKHWFKYKYDFMTSTQNLPNTNEQVPFIPNEN